MKRLQQVVGRAHEDATATAEEPAPRSSRDNFIGPFRIVRKLGEGGMGVVYEAEQQHPKRPVALKVIRGGRHVDDHALRLFQREIQTLARLSHPGIAQLYETGATDDGMHFFAMELIRGVPLSEWLRKRSDGPITPAEMKLRLGVFRKICDAVAYAHQKGVIHRDLKPGNILIPTPRAGSSIEDAVPEVKILDFGLARMTDTDVQMTTYVTEMGKVQGTLPYMSPEQVRGNPDEIDLRTDVYSLGVILYEMVTGHLPYDLSKLQLPEAVRIICEETPRSLSATFTGTRRLDADVATIAGKCLEKETARRYQSATALSEEVQRYLTDQPILARPPSAAYQFRKLVLRHKGPFAAAAGAFVLLLAFSIAMAFQAARIARERDRASQAAATAERVSDFMERLFQVSNPFAAKDHDLTAREILDEGAARIETELQDQPAVQTRLMRTIGSVYDRLGIGDKAQPLLERAVELAEKHYGPESLELADALDALAGTGTLRIDEMARAHAIRSRLLRPDDPRMIRSLYRLGSAQGASSMPEAEATLREALTRFEASRLPDEQLHLWILNDLGLIVGQRDPGPKIAFLRKAQAIRDRIYPEHHADRLVGLNNLGWVLMESGDLTQARRCFEAVLPACEKALGPDHTLLATVMDNLGDLEIREGRPDRARPLLERALRIFERNVAAQGSLTAVDHPAIHQDILRLLGLVDESQGRQAEALDHLGRARELFEDGIGGTDPSADYARVLRKAGRIAEAEEVERGMKHEAAAVGEVPRDN